YDIGLSGSSFPKIRSNAAMLVMRVGVSGGPAAVKPTNAVTAVGVPVGVFPAGLVPRRRTAGLVACAITYVSCGPAVAGSQPVRGKECSRRPRDLPESDDISVMIDDEPLPSD